MNPELLFVGWGLQCLPAVLGVALVKPVGTWSLKYGDFICTSYWLLLRI